MSISKKRIIFSIITIVIAIAIFSNLPFHIKKPLKKLHLSQGTSLAINQPHNANLWTGDTHYFYIDVDSNYLRVSLTTDDFWSMDTLLNVTLDGVSYISDNPGSQNEEVIVDLESPTRVYITVYCKSNNGYYTLTVFNTPPWLLPLIIGIIVSVIIGIISIVGIVYYKRNKKSKEGRKISISTTENPYVKKSEKKEEKQENMRKKRMCRYCGNVAENSAKICEFCGNEF